MFRILLRTLVFLIVLAVALIVVVKVRYGGETVPFPDRSTDPMLPGSALEIVAKLEEPPGNIAVSASGRVFINFHPEGRPESMKVAELVNGQPVPFPSGEFQEPRGAGKPYFDTVFSLRIDGQNRLWTLDPGFHGLHTPRLLAFDLDSRQMVHQWDLPSDVAGIGSYVQDFQVAPDGAFVYLADVSALALHPAIIAYDVKRHEGRRVLESEPSTIGGNFTILSKGREMSLLGGLYKMHPGLDSIALDHRDAWLYFGPMSGDSMFRVPSADLRLASRANIASHVQRYGDKPQSDGLTMDSENSIYITDVEHGAIMVLNRKLELRTLIRDERIRWPDGLSLTEDGWLYFTDSDIPDLILESREHVKGARPFYVFRVQTGKKGRAGH
jgi:sugar lactone lactonase YvrE